MGRFVEAHGKKVFEEHTQRSLDVWAKAICDQSVSLSTVHDTVLKDGPLHTVLPLLILQPPLDVLYPTGLNLDTATFDTEYFASSLHNKSLILLKDFASALELKVIEVPNIKKLDGASANMNTEQAVMVLELLCEVRNTAMVAAVVHGALLVPQGESQKKAVVENKLYGFLTQAVRALQQGLGRIDELVESRLAVSIEAEGWQLPVPLAVVRQWRAGTSTFAGRALLALLAGFVGTLEAKVTACRSQRPAWEAIFDQGKNFNEQLALKLFKGKLTTVINHHNAVHSSLSRLNGAAKVLEVFPKLPAHEVTGEAVAVALSTLSRAALVAVLIQGVELLQKFRDDPQGGEKATAFLAQHRASHEKDVPSSFWCEFENMAQCASGPAAVPHQALQCGNVASSATSSSTVAISSSFLPFVKSSAVVDAKSENSISSLATSANSVAASSKVPATIVGIKRLRRA